MNSVAEADRYSLQQLNRLHDEALAYAPRLRDQAINDFWHEVVDQVLLQQQRARRSAERFAQSLNRHNRRRGMVSDQPQGSASC